MPAREREAAPAALRLDAGRFAVPQHPVKAAPAGLQELLAVVRTNRQSRGEQVAWLAGDGDFYLPLKALREWVAVPPDTPVVMVAGEPLVRLRDLAGSRTRFDESRLELDVDFPPEWFPGQAFTYRTGLHAPLTLSDNVGALLNYGVSGVRTGGQSFEWNLSTDTTLSYRGWALQNQLFRFETSERKSWLRGLTQLTRDDPSKLTRFTAGDFFATPTELTGDLVLGGLGFSRAFQVDPYFVRFPTAAFRGLADVPSEVDFYVGNNRIYRQQIGPGPFEIGNVSYLTGQRDVRVVVRDALGHERTVLFPFYFAAQGLAQGLHDFSYQVGAIRENAATRSGEYGPGAFSATHRYGFTDHITAGFHAEGTREAANAGPSLILRSDALGVASAAWLASRDRASGANGHAYALGYTYQGGSFFGLASIRRETPDFAFLRTRDSHGASPRDDTFSIGYSPAGFGTLSLSYRNFKPADDPASRVLAAAYTVPFGKDWTFEASLRRTRGFGEGYEALATVQYRPRRDLTTFTTLKAEEGGNRTATFQLGNIVPEGEGLGYRVSASHAWGPGGRTDIVAPDLVYRMREAVVQAGVSSTVASGVRSDVYTVAATGSVAYAGGHVGFSRPIDDSFAVVQVEPPLAGVRVYLNRQEIGRTDRSGRLFLPRLVSYVENYLSIEDRDIPIEYAISEAGKVIVPYNRSGNVAVFRVAKVRAITGTLRYSRAGRPMPLAATLFTLQVGGKSLEMPTGSNGDFYFENVPAGDYPASVEIEGVACRFHLVIPPGEEPVVSLDHVQTCSLP